VALIACGPRTEHWFARSGYQWDPICQEAGRWTPCTSRSTAPS